MKQPQPDSLFSVMQKFNDLSQGIEFCANDIALFYALLYTWNSARRPDVIEQWARRTATNAGMSERVMVSSREKLVEAGVLFHEKSGNRGVPRYSFNAILSKLSPFLPAIIDSKPASKQVSNSVVSGGVTTSVTGGVLTRGSKEQVKAKIPPNPQGGIDGKTRSELAASIQEKAESIYNAYPRKVGKTAAMKSITKALKFEPAEKLIESVKAYSDATALKDRQFIPHPSTWFNQGRYNDDPKEWIENQPNGSPKKTLQELVGGREISITYAADIDPNIKDPYENEIIPF